MRRVSDITRAEMFRHWCDNQAEYYVGKKVGLCQKTVKKYRQLDKWDKRLEEIRLKSRAKADYDIVQERVKTLKLMKLAKGLYAKKLTAAVKGEDEVKVTLRDIDTIVRLEAFLAGRPEMLLSMEVSDERATKALKLLEKLGSEAIRSLGDFLARNEKKK